ncbi:MAG: hypothetical protein FJ030_11410 [Chloroflexi bacterium]|nr:hypothetical protein [Chloroflexota bacterium]
MAAQSIVADLLEEQRATKRRINVLATGLRWELYGGWGEANGLVFDFGDSPEQRTEIAPWLASGDPLYFVELLPRAPLPDHPHGAVLELARTYDLPGSADWPHLYVGPSVANLWRVAGTTGELSKQIADFVFGNPTKLAAEYNSVAGYLNRAPDLPIVLYPPNQLYALEAADLDASRLRPIANSWPVNFEGAQAEIGQAAQSASQLWVVMVFEGRGDPQRQIESWLNTHLYRMSEQWFGPVRVLRYATMPDATPTLRTVGAVFGEQIELSSAVVADTATSSGGAIRMALNWRYVAATTVSYKFFTHIFDADGQLIAQYDGIPQGGLAPTDSWTPGQSLNDLFAVTLPPDLPSGVYTIRVGMYDPASGQRLLITQGASPGIDSLEVEQFAVK